MTIFLIMFGINLTLILILKHETLFSVLTLCKIVYFKTEVELIIIVKGVIYKVEFKYINFSTPLGSFYPIIFTGINELILWFLPINFGEVWLGDSHRKSNSDRIESRIQQFLTGIPWTVWTDGQTYNWYGTTARWRSFISLPDNLVNKKIIKRW